MCSGTTIALMTLLRFTNCGWANVTSTLPSGVAVAVSTLSESRLLSAGHFFRISYEKATSAAVSGLPSDHFTFSRIVKVTFL